jgi:hypothetical protein
LTDSKADRDMRKLHSGQGEGIRCATVEAVGSEKLEAAKDRHSM